MTKSRNMVMIAAVLMMAAVGFAEEDFDTIPASEIDAHFTSAKVVETVRPERVFYTRSREIEGYVTLELTVDTNGDVESAKVLYKTSQLAINNAINAVSQWKFEPGTLNGQAVRSTVAFSLPFGRDLEILEDEKYNEQVILDDTTLALLQR